MADYFASSSYSMDSVLQQLNTNNKALQAAPSSALSRYENQKRRDWTTFGHYIASHSPPLALAGCSGLHVVEFLRYLDQFGRTKIHSQLCPFFGHTSSSGPCTCPLYQAWGSLDALVGRLRAAYEEHGGKDEMNPFGAVAVRMYLREVRDSQAKARGISYTKKKRKRPKVQPHAQRLDSAATSHSGASVISQLKFINNN